MDDKKPLKHENEQQIETQGIGGLKMTLPRALTVVISAALVIVTIGYFMYWTSQERKYDLARPGQAVDSKGLDVTTPEEDTSKPINEAAITTILDFLEGERQALNNMNPLDPDNLSDENLQLVPSRQPSF